MSTGHYLALHSSATASTAIDVDDSPIVSPNMASRIDRKLDDGSAVTGRVMAFGDDTVGADTLCATRDGVYADYVPDRTCGMYIRTPR